MSLSEQTPKASPSGSHRDPLQALSRRTENSNLALLFVGQLPYDVGEDELYTLFQCYGDVQHCLVLRDKRKGSGGAGSHPGATGHRGSHHHLPYRSVGGSAFVAYRTTLEADCAIASLHGVMNMRFYTAHCSGCAGGGSHDSVHSEQRLSQLRDPERCLQVMYGMDSGLVSEFGRRHTVALRRQGGGRSKG